MQFDWLAWSNPVAIWWGFLLAVSAANIALWLVLHRHFRNRSPDRRFGQFRIELMVLLSRAYVFGCAFRSVLPRADVQRNLPVRHMALERPGGRSVATVAEICFAIQWAIVIYQLARLARSDTARNISIMIVP